MRITDLNRQFRSPDTSEDDYSYLLSESRKRKSNGWESLLAERLVVILASASSGKTLEFQRQAEKLNNDDKVAVFIPIEDLADEDLDDILDGSILTKVQDWRKSDQVAYFFLDSVDEAKLAGKKEYRKALRKLKKFLQDDLDRAHVYISCRPSDWSKSDDEVETIRIFELNKTVSQQQEFEELTEEEASKYIRKVVSRDESHDEDSETSNPKKVTPLKVVMLAPLNGEQQRNLAKNSGRVNDIDKFILAVNKNGLEPYAKRPGDLLDLASYWNEYGRFDSLKKMTEYGIQNLLQETKSGRKDSTLLSEAKAREGAELLAVALLLSKKLSILKPGNLSRDSDDNPIDSSEILKTWTDAEREVLLRKGIFAPASFGAIRFQHRSTIEYLAASWFSNQLLSESFREKANSLIFQEAFGVKTITTELRPVVAWLALEDDGILNRVLDLEPFDLIRHGDAKSLPFEVRRRLLINYMTADLKGDVADDKIEHRAIWAFSDAMLESTIRDCWSKNERWSFRLFLLGLISEGKIIGCSDLVLDEAINLKSKTSLRTTAVHCLHDLGDKKSLKKVASLVVKGRLPKTKDAEDNENIVEKLYPEFITTKQLLKIIKASKKPKKYSYRGYGPKLTRLAESCPAKNLDFFLNGLANLAYKKPHLKYYEPVSEEYGYLAQHFEKMSKAIISRFSKPEKSDGLIRVIIGSSLTQQTDHSLGDKVPLYESIKSNRELVRKVFWEDVRYLRKVEGKRDFRKHPWQMFSHGLRGTSWDLNRDDLDWLESETQDASLSLIDRETAFYALIAKHREYSLLPQSKDQLFELSKISPICKKWLQDMLKPSTYEKDEKKRKRKRLKREAKKKMEHEEWAKSWEDLKVKLKKNPPADDFSNGLTKESRYFISSLSKWLRLIGDNDDRLRAKNWRKIKLTFGDDIAEAYAQHMMALWRETKPERPKWKGNSKSIKYTTLHSFIGLGIEADRDENWAKNLSEEEFIVACKHLFLSDQGIPSWMNDLLDADEKTTLKYLRHEFKKDWMSKSDGHSDIISFFRNADSEISENIGKELLSVMVNNDPGTLNKWDAGRAILGHLKLDLKTHNRLFSRAAALLSKKGLEIRDHITILKLMFYFDIEKSTPKLKKLLQKSDQKTAEDYIARIFSRHYGLGGVPVRENTKASTLIDLLELCYKHIKLKDDEARKSGVRSPSSRENAEDARSSVLSALLDHPSEEAYLSIRKFAKRNDIASDEAWFGVLSKRMVERAITFKPWKSDEIVTFVSFGEFPIQTQRQFYDLIYSALVNLQTEFDNEDMTAKSVLLEAPNEDAVRDWLGAELQKRVGKNATFVKENHVLHKKRPDIVAIARHLEAEVVIELKHSDKGWTIDRLKNAIQNQIAGRYLKVERRRSGILFISRHHKKYWVNPNGGKRVSFDKLLDRLSLYAKKVETNANEPIRLGVLGLDCQEF